MEQSVRLAGCTETWGNIKPDAPNLSVDAPGGGNEVWLNSCGVERGSMVEVEGWSVHFRAADELQL
jgi:hypothetical protein